MRFFLFPDLKGLKKMIKTVQRDEHNSINPIDPIDPINPIDPIDPIDPVSNTFINEKNNKNVLPYNGIYKRIQAHRQAQNQYMYTCINNANKPLDGLILASIEQNKQAGYTQVFPQVIQKKSLKSNSSGIKPDRENHTDSHIAILN